MKDNKQDSNAIAIIGMAGRFPKARNIDEFWENLCQGRDSISFFPGMDGRAVGNGDIHAADHDDCVNARGVLEDAEMFDAAFFDVKPREAEIMDPQHRVFLECAWEALEDAGTDPARFEGPIGVFGGMSMNTYWAASIAARPDVVAQAGEYQTMLGNDKDFLPTRVSYKLNLRGPSLNIQTACSTSLVAVCAACQSLLCHQCDAALAGAVAISYPRRKGYQTQEGGILSPDGHCRPFDAKASGTVPGEGVGVVILKRLADALAAGDDVRAVIRGFAVNNDGAQKVGYTAPSVDGQAEVIVMAQTMAQCPPDTIGYVEAHGTATALGDPIEVAGLTAAFCDGTARRNFCALGSVKGNIGHLDTVAGVAGLIKTVLMLQHRRLPPSLHFDQPNPRINFSDSPFYVNTRLCEWSSAGTPRRAGVSSFGIGGTNAHVVLEEAPETTGTPSTRPVQLLLLSARTDSALQEGTSRLVARLKAEPSLSLSDVAATLQLGRREFAHRRVLACRDVADAVTALESVDAKRVLTGFHESEDRGVVFMFPGQGAQRVNMGLELYRHEAVFRQQVDQSCEILAPMLGMDLRSVLYPPEDQTVWATHELLQTAMAQPALFVIEHALAQLWMHWGVKPRAMIGHSLGEYVAACLAGVFCLDDALALVAARGRMMQDLPVGMMLAVRQSEAEITAALGPDLSLAAVNGPSACVVSGPVESIQRFGEELNRREIAWRPVPTSHAFHSAMVDPILVPFEEKVKKLSLGSPQIPFISNLTGSFAGPEVETPEYWSRHLRQTVRFADGIGELLQDSECILLETGPGHTLTAAAQHHPARTATSVVMASMNPHKDGESDFAALINTVGQLWLAGAPLDWSGFQAGEKRKRVRLPVYAFERKRYCLEPVGETGDPCPRQAMPAMPEFPADKSPVGGALLAGLKTLLCRLSGLPAGMVTDDATFVDMGFDSLFLTQVSLALEKTYHVKVAFRQLIELYRTPSALASHLESIRKTEAKTHELHSLEAALPEPAGNGCMTNASHLGEVRRNLAHVIPLTPGQKELWFASQMSDASSCACNECRLVHLRGLLDTDALIRAISRLVDRHEALRTTFSTSGESQHIFSTCPINISTADLADLAEAERNREIASIEEIEAGTPFDLVNGPLIRVRLLRLLSHHHVLMVSIHHIVCDGTSFGILMGDLAEIYSEECAGRQSRLSAPLQLSEFVHHESALEGDSAAASHENYWLKAYADSPPMLDLPIDYPRAPEWKFTGARATRTLPAGLKSDLHRLASRFGCTFANGLLTAFGVFLHRITGQSDIVIGVPVAERSMPGSQSLVGHCISFLPLRSHIQGDAGFEPNLREVQRAFFDAHEHRGFPFGSLIQKLNIPHDLNRMPLVSATFNVERVRDQWDFAGLEVNLQPCGQGYTNFDLSFNVAESNHELRIDCRFNSSLFNRATIRRWLGHFQTLLEAVVKNPSEPVAHLSILSDFERQQLIRDWNDTQVDYPENECLHHLFEAQVGRTPDAPAVACGQTQLTYRELNARADLLAGRLREIGVTVESTVGICAERSPEMVIAILAVLKSGGAYVPLDPAYPAERLSLILKNASVHTVLTQRSLDSSPGFDLPKLKRICLDDPETWKPRAENGENDALVTQVASGHLAYVIHTSGSTGVPKGVAIEHRNAVNFIRWAQGVFTAEELSNVLFSTSVCFDLSIFEMFVTLASGGRVVLAQNVIELSDLPQRDEITLINSVPSAVAELLESGGLPSSVRIVNLAGEPLKTALVDRLLATGTVEKVHDLYGPSETTTYSTWARRRAGERATIGSPIANTRIYVLDANQELAPVGVIGEICIGGKGVARGYLNRPDLTALGFVADTFVGEAGARMYKTGDRGRWLPDGNLELLGRLDGQVKIRGHRIELGEVEAIMARHPAVRECVVLAREDIPDDRRMVAYVVAARKETADARVDLRAYLQGKLPGFAIPSAIVFLDKLPRTPNGKVNRRELPAPDQPAAEADVAAMPPATPVEEAILRIWCEVLRIRRAGTHESFFQLGGNSLLMIRVISRIRKQLRVELPVRRFFEAPTIAGLAAAIEEMVVEQIKDLSDEEVRHFAGSPR